ELFLKGRNIEYVKDDELCEGCLHDKQHRRSFRSRPTRAQSCGEQINMDVCGKMPVESLGGKEYFVVFKDDFSRFRCVYFIRNKSEVPEMFKKFVAVAKNAGHVIKTIMCDGGTEFLNSDMRNICEENAI